MWDTVVESTTHLSHEMSCPWCHHSVHRFLPCCQNGTLPNATAAYTSRMDLVLRHRAVRPVSSAVVGDTPFEATLRSGPRAPRPGKPAAGRRLGCRGDCDVVIRSRCPA
jgi:hypothetical protein